MLTEQQLSEMEMFPHQNQVVFLVEDIRELHRQLEQAQTRIVHLTEINSDLGESIHRLIGEKIAERVQAIEYRTELERIRDIAKSWEGRSDVPFWNLGDIAAAALIKKRNDDD